MFYNLYSISVVLINNYNFEEFNREEEKVHELNFEDDEMDEDIDIEMLDNNNNNNNNSNKNKNSHKNNKKKNKKRIIIDYPYLQGDNKPINDDEIFLASKCFPFLFPRERQQQNKLGIAAGDPFYHSRVHAIKLKEAASHLMKIRQKW